MVLWAGAVIGAAIVSMEISLSRVAEITMSGVLLGLAFGACALAVGSANGKRGLSIGVGGSVGGSRLLFNALVPMVAALKPASKLSLGADPLTNGLNLAHAAVLIGLTAALVAVAVVAFERRDLGV